MPFDRALLLVVDPARAAQNGLKRATLIAERLGLAVQLLHPAPDTAPDQRAWLDRLAVSLADQGLAVEARRAWRGSLQATVLQALKEGGAGLLVKDADPPSALEGLVTPGDWKLMRFAPCPVLLVKQERPWGARPILAAVDANPHDADHARLNRQILQAAARIATTSGGTLHLASAYSTAMQASDPAEAAEAKAARYRQACGALCRELAIEPAGLHLGEGPVEGWLVKTERDLDAALVVLGTVARRGLRALVMGGNTAESILARLDADTLTLKPEGTDQLLLQMFDEEDDHALS